jgi:amino acid adenylation domain-containing protein
VVLPAIWIGRGEWGFMSESLDTYGYDLSPQQYNIFRYAGGEVEKNCRVHLCVEIVGKISKERICHALQAVINKYEILRTAFVLPKNGTLPIQEVYRQSEPNHRLESMGTRSFDDCVRSLWESDPWNGKHSKVNESALQSRLVEISEDHYLFQLLLPVVCADTTAIELLMQEIVEVYRHGNSQDGQDVIQYADVAGWLLEQQEDTADEYGREWWSRQQNAHGLPVFIAPNVRDTQAQQKKYLSWEVSDQVVDNMNKLSGTLGISLRAVWLGIWWWCLQRISGDELVMAVEFSGRSQCELTSVLGLLDQVAPLLVEWHVEHSLADHLIAIDQLIGRAEQRITYFRPDDDWQNECCGFSLREFSSVFTSDDELKIVPYCRQDTMYYFPLHLDLACFCGPARMQAKLWYDPARIREHSAKLLLQQFKSLLAVASQAGDQSLSTISQPQADVGTYRFTEHNYSVFEKIGETAGKYPNSLAVADEKRSVDYQTLMQHSSAIGQWLFKRGAAPEARVAILLGRSINDICSMIGVWYSGGAFVPIDPTLPPQKIHQILNQLNPFAVIGQLSDIDRIPCCANVLKLALDQFDFSTEDTQKCVSPPMPKSAAYIVMTSGSSGQAKPVVIEHRQLAAYVHSLKVQFPNVDQWRIALPSLISADLAFTGVFLALCNGGSLHMPSEHVMLDGGSLSAFVRLRRIECMKITPSHLSAILKSGGSNDVLPEKLLILGGEQASWKLIKDFHRRKPQLQIFNHYGPTETTIGVTFFSLTQQMIARYKKPPLGKGFSHAAVYVLDQNLKPLGVWETGQIYIGGVSLSRGYLDCPAETAAAFLPNPFNRESGARMYDSGDRAFYHENGVLEFVGRRDRQINLNGVRIEPDEIEQALKKIAGISDALVIYRDNPPRSARIVAFIVTRERDVVGDSDIRLALSQQFSKKVIPSAIVRVNEIPLGSTGKIDFQRLPEDVGTKVIKHFPKSQIEKEIAGIWCELLGVDQVGVDENFFDIGGHSLLLMELHYQLSERLAIDVSLVELFNHSTVQAMATLKYGQRSTARPPTRGTKILGRFDALRSLAAGKASSHNGNTRK